MLGTSGSALAETPEPVLVPTPAEVADESTPWAGPSELTAVDYVASGTIGAGILAMELLLPSPTVARWRGVVLLDGMARDAMLPASDGARDGADGVSDVLLTSLLAMPLVDAAVAWGVHGQGVSAARMLAIDAQSFGLTYLVTELTKRLVARERPYGAECDGQGPGGRECDSETRYESFLSGHTAMAFTAAGLVCAHHTNLPLFGGGAADTGACVAALGGAAAVGALRIAADKHYLSDVLAGAALGVVSGYFLPKWLHYGSDDEPTEPPGPRASVSPMLSPDTLGVSVSGVW